MGWGGEKAEAVADGEEGRLGHGGGVGGGRGSCARQGLHHTPTIPVLSSLRGWLLMSPRYRHACPRVLHLALPSSPLQPPNAATPLPRRPPACWRPPRARWRRRRTACRWGPPTGFRAHGVFVYGLVTRRDTQRLPHCRGSGPRRGHRTAPLRAPMKLSTHNELVQPNVPSTACDARRMLNAVMD